MSYQSAPVPVLQPDAISMAEVLRGIWRRRLMILSAALAACVLAILYVASQTPRYTTQAMVLVQNLGTPFNRSQPDATQDRTALDERDVLSQVSVITSRDLGERAVRELNLIDRPEFDSLKSGLGFLTRLKIALGFQDDPRLKTPVQRALARYGDMLNVYQIPQSKVIVIQYGSTNPETAAEVANRVAELYVTSTKESQSEPTEQARDWLAAQIEDLRKKVAESEA